MPHTTVPEIMRRKRATGQAIAMVTAYDALFAHLLDTAGVDIVLVGDSLGMVVQGESDTLGVTLDDMVYHTRLVARGVSKALLVADMPFLSAGVSESQTLAHAGRLLKEGRAHSVKLEGGAQIAPTVERLSHLGIPVMGHVGLWPQHRHRAGGFRRQGKDPEAAKQIVSDAKALESAGAYSLVVEAVPQELAKEITGAVSIPTIGIGSGPHCDGQVLVGADLLGLTPRRPSFVHPYAQFFEEGVHAVRRFCEDVREGRFGSGDS